MEASPCAPLVMAEADFLLEVLIITLDSPAQLGEIDEVAERHVGATDASQNFVGAASSLGHSISNVSSANRASPRIGAARTRTRAKRDRSFALLPSRHVMVRHAFLGRLRAKASTLTRFGFGSPSPTGRTLTVETMAAT